MELKTITKITHYADDFETTFTPIEESIELEKTATGYEMRYLIQESDPMAPNECGDDGAFLVHYHRDFWIENNNVVTEDNIREWYNGQKIEQQKEYFIFSVSALIHSGVWLALGDQGFSSDSGGWDTSHVGAVLISKEEFKTKDKARKYALGLVENWNQYLSGDVYLIVKDVYNNKKELINFDCIGGYSGYNDALESLKTEI